MAGRRGSPKKPVDIALQRLLDLATKNAPPSRMAREVEIIADEWSRDPDAAPSDTKQQMGELLEVLASGVADAREQVSDVDPGDALAVKQADATLAALTATRDAADRTWTRLQG